MRKLLVSAAFAAAAVVPVAASAGGRAPQANCPGTVVWVVYPNASGPGCTMQPGQTLNEYWLPSTWTLAQAHTYCADKGSVGAFTRHGGVANVCPDIDV